MLLGSNLDADNNQLINVVLESAATSALNAALTIMGRYGYDTTALRLKIFDGTTVRKLLQDNDLSPDTTLGGSSASDVIAATQKAVKAYVDNAITTGQQAFTDFDASASINLPSGATLSSRYRVSTGGTVQGVVLQAMDVFYPRVSSPSVTTPTDWIFVQGNSDQATTSVLGMVILATLAQIQTNAGGDANKVITVAQLNAWETALGRVRKYTPGLMSLSAGANGITHGLNSSTPVVQFFDSNGPIIYQWTVSSANTISVVANKSRSNVQVIVYA